MMMEPEAQKENTKAVDDDDDIYTIITVASTTVATQHHANDGDDDKEQQRQQQKPILQFIMNRACRSTWTFFFSFLVMCAFGRWPIDLMTWSLVLLFAFMGYMTGYVLINYCIAMCFPTTYAKMLATEEEEAAEANNQNYQGCWCSRRNDSGKDNDDDSNA